MQTRAVTCVSEEVISVDKDRTLQPKEQVGTHPQDTHTHMRAHAHADVQTCNLSYENHQLTTVLLNSGL